MLHVNDPARRHGAPAAPENQTSIKSLASKHLGRNGHEVPAGSPASPGPLESVDSPSLRPPQEVFLEDVDEQDGLFQFRLEWSAEDLVAALAHDGQREPIDLLGSKPPYRIIDGFRRVDALRRLGCTAVLAHIHDLDEASACRIAFVRNAQRKDFRSMEKAIGVARALELGWSVAQVAAEFCITERHVRRCRDRAGLSDALRALRDEGLLTMALALVLKRFQVADPESWALRCKQGDWSPQELERELLQGLVLDSSGRKRTYLRVGKRTLRVYAFEMSASSPEVERDRAAAALRRALEFLDQLAPSPQERHGQGPEGSSRTLAAESGREHQ